MRDQERALTVFVLMVGRRAGSSGVMDRRIGMIRWFRAAPGRVSGGALRGSARRHDTRTGECARPAGRCNGWRAMVLTCE